MSDKVYTVEEITSMVEQLNKAWAGMHSTLAFYDDDLKEMFEKWYNYYDEIFEAIDWDIQTPEVKKIMEEYINAEK